MKLLFIVNLLKKNAFLTKRIYFLFDNHKFKAVFFFVSLSKFEISFDDMESKFRDSEGKGN